MVPGHSATDYKVDKDSDLGSDSDAVNSPILLFGSNGLPSTHTH